jgi:hypothetical protein
MASNQKFRRIDYDGRWLVVKFKRKSPEDVPQFQRSPKYQQVPGV